MGKQDILLENRYNLARVQSRCFVYTLDSLIYRMVKNARRQKYQDIVSLKRLVKQCRNQLLDPQQFEDRVLSMCSETQL